MSELTRSVTQRAPQPGDIFVHRNIANQVHADDDSVLSVLAYAILHLGVEQGSPLACPVSTRQQSADRIHPITLAPLVVVAGHTNCGGAAAALAAAKASPSPATSSLTRFIAPLVDIARSLGPEADLNHLIEENIKNSVSMPLLRQRLRSITDDCISRYVGQSPRPV